MVKRIGIDFDGTLTLFSNLKLPWWVFGPLFPLTFISPPNKKIIEILRKLKKAGHEIVIISSRPKFFTRLSEMWLKFHNIPYSRLICAGFIEGRRRKLEIIKKEKIRLLIDDDKGIANFLRQDSISVLYPG